MTCPRAVHALLLAGALALAQPAAAVALPRPVSESLAVAALRQGVRIAPGTRFGVGGEFRRFIRLPFTLPEAELQRAVPGLAAAWRETSREKRDTARRPAPALLADPSVL